MTGGLKGGSSYPVLIGCSSVSGKVEGWLPISAYGGGGLLTSVELCRLNLYFSV